MLKVIPPYTSPTEAIARFPPMNESTFKSEKQGSRAINHKEKV